MSTLLSAISLLLAMAFVGFILCIIDVSIYNKKMPNESLEEINKIIEDYEDLIKHENNVVRQERLLDEKEYWEQQKEKLINYQKKTGKIYEISRMETKNS